MKRVLWIILALLLFAAPAIAESATVEGDWELISIVIEGNIYENLTQQGMTMTMRLEADGTGVQTVNGEIYPCTWAETDGEILIGDSDGTMSYALQADGTLRGEDQVGDVMLFARAAAADSVAGEWKLTSAETEGITVNDIVDQQICQCSYEIVNPEIKGVGFILMKGNDDLCNYINEQLTQYRNSGLLQELNDLSESEAKAMGII